MTVVEYGDFECPNYKQAAPAVKLMLERSICFCSSVPSPIRRGSRNATLRSMGRDSYDPFATNGRFPFQTNPAGVFAIGDVLSGSIKHVAAAVGEGAQVIAALHRYLEQTVQRQATTVAVSQEAAHG